MDIKEKIEEIAGKLQGDKNLMSRFQADPVKTIEGLLGVDLPDETIQKVVAGIKAKLGLDSAGGILGAIGGILGKK